MSGKGVEVTDPALLALLGGGSPAAPAEAGLGTEVLDPAILAQLEETQTPAAPTPVAQKRPELLGGWHNLLGPAEAIASIGSDLGGTVLGGLGGLKMAELGGTADDAGDTVRKVMQTLHYEPQTKAGAKIRDVATYIPEKIGSWLADKGNKVGEKVTDVTGSPALGAGSNTAVQMIPALLTRAGRGKATEWNNNKLNAKLNEEFVNAPKDTLMLEAQKQGFRALPAMVNPTTTNRVIQGLSGESRLEGALSLSNQIVANQRVQKALGLGATTPLRQGLKDLILKNPKNPELRNLLKAIDPVTEYVDMQKLARIYAAGLAKGKRTIPKELDVAAKFAHENPSVTKLPRDTKGGAMSLTDLGMGGLAASMVGNPYYTALNLMRPGMRSTVNSPMGTKMISPPDYKLSKAHRAIAAALTSPGTPGALAAGQASLSADQKTGR